MRALQHVRGRSRIWQKLAVIGLAFALPLGVTTRFLVVESATKIEFAANEVRGVEYLEPLNALLVDLTAYKALDGAALAGSRPDGDLGAVADRIDTGYAALLDVDGRLGTFLDTTIADLNGSGIRAAATSQSANWDALKRRPSSLARNEQIRTLLITDVRTLISYVGLSSNLLLDPELATYHSAHALVRRGPELTDRIAELSATVDQLLLGDVVSFRDRTRAASAVALVQDHAVALQEELFTAFSDARRGGNHALEDDVGPLLHTAYGSVSNFTTLTTLGLVQADTVTMDRDTYGRAGERASLAVTQLWTTLAEHETAMVRERQQSDAHDRLVALSTVLASLLLTVVLTLWLSRRIATRVGTVARAAAGLAAGDLTRRVAVRGRDEIGVMSTAFNGMAERLQAVVEDQQRAQRTLRAERDFVGAVLEVAGSLVLVLDRSGRIVRFNRACELTTGYVADEVIGVPLWDLFITAEEAVGVRAVFDGLSAGSFPMTYENDWIARSGSLRRIAWANTALIDDDTGDVTHIIATGIDYTERRQAEDAVDRMRRHNELVLTSAGEGIVGLDAESRTTFVNPSAARMLGLTPEELVGSTLHEMIHGHRPGGALHTAVDCPLHGTVSGGAAARDASELFWRADGTSLPAEYLSTPIREDGVLLGAVVTFDDITTRRAAETDLREAQERFRQAFDNAVIGMCLVGLDGGFLQVNRSLCEMLDYDEERLLALGMSTVTHPDDAEEMLGALDRMAAGDLSTYKAEKRYVAADGRIVWALVAASIVRSQDGSPLYCVMQMEDMTERREAARQLTFQALHDSLTGLPNRALLMDRLRLAVARAALAPTVNAVFFVDLDGFKAVNDSLGHEVGDEVLREVARRLAASIRPSDTAARLGGDEFVLLCEGVVSPQGALDIAERLERALAPDLCVTGSAVAVTASIGIAIATDATATPESLLSDADAAMYRAKARGKNRFEVFDEELRVVAIDRLGVESTLREALREDRFVLHFQPVVDLGSGEVVGVESLVRLNHPERGLLPPGDFIQVAEDSGLIVPIGAWVLGDACRRLADWRRSGAVPAGMPTAVNLSARQANRMDLVQTVTRALEESGIEPGALALELTETVLMEADTMTIRQLQELRDMGVRLGIDDFGTGYSSLTYLKRLPVSFVKVDRSFVAGVVDDPSDRAIVTAVVGLAHALGLTTIAEGVETAEQLRALREIGCEQAQGYYLGRPQAGPPALLGIADGGLHSGGVSANH